MSLRNSFGLYPQKNSLEAVEYTNKFIRFGFNRVTIEMLLENRAGEVQLKIKDIKKLCEKVQTILPDLRAGMEVGDLLAFSDEDESFDIIEQAINADEKEFEKEKKEQKQKLDNEKADYDQLQSTRSRYLADSKITPENNQAQTDTVHLLTNNLADITIKQKKFIKDYDEYAATSKQKYIPPTSILFYAALSGNEKQLDRALALFAKYDPDLWHGTIDSGMNLLHAAILSKNIKQVNKVLKLAEKQKIVFEPEVKSKHRIHFGHLAALTGSLEIIELVAPMVDMKKADVYGYTTIDYAAVKGHEKVVQKLQESDLQLSENLDDFYFGGIRSPNVNNNNYRPKI